MLELMKYSNENKIEYLLIEENVEQKHFLIFKKILVDKMNEYIKEQREKYNSLFLTNYRESNSIARKRISFDLAFKICNYMLSSI